MNRFKILCLLGSVAIFVASGCKKVESDNILSTGRHEFTILPTMPEAKTKVTETSFEINDKIGVYVAESGNRLQLVGNAINNAEFIYNGNSWSAASKQFWNDGSYNVYAYYPYMEIVDDINDCSFSVQVDQSAKSGYQMSDFLWGTSSEVAASSSPVEMQFSHKLSRVIVRLEKSETYEGEIPDNCEVYIHNTVVDALVDIATGDAVKDPYGEVSSIKARKISSEEFDAIVIPQFIQTRTPMVEVLVDNVSYMMEGMLSFKPGCSVTLVVTLSKNPDQTKIEIGGGIGGWN